MCWRCNCEAQNRGWLIELENQKNRKPLIVYGARQVGKTYSIISFGRKNYADYAYFNFEANGELKSIFDRNLEPKRIVLELGAVLGKVITEHTLIIFDEIQAAPKALTSLKYFANRHRNIILLRLEACLELHLRGRTILFRWVR